VAEYVSTITHLRLENRALHQENVRLGGDTKPTIKKELIDSCAATVLNPG